jgi:hypothetical protein
VAGRNTMRRITVLVERFVTLDGSFIGTATIRMRSTLHHHGYLHTGSSVFASPGIHVCRYGRFAQNGNTVSGSGRGSWPSCASSRRVGRSPRRQGRVPRIEQLEDRFRRCHRPDSSSSLLHTQTRREEHEPSGLRLSTSDKAQWTCTASSSRPHQLAGNGMLC